MVDQQFFEDEEETVVVKALEGRGARDHFGHKVVVLKFDIAPDCLLVYPFAGAHRGHEGH